MTGTFKKKNISKNRYKADRATVTSMYRKYLQYPIQKSLIKT